MELCVTHLRAFSAVVQCVSFHFPTYMLWLLSYIGPLPLPPYLSSHWLAIVSLSLLSLALLVILQIHAAIHRVYLRNDVACLPARQEIQFFFHVS